MFERCCSGRVRGPPQGIHQELWTGYAFERAGAHVHTHTYHSASNQTCSSLTGNTSCGDGGESPTTLITGYFPKRQT